MSIWSKIIDKVSGNVSAYANEEASRDASHYAIVDCEVGMKDKRVHDIGAFTVIFALSFCHKSNILPSVHQKLCNNHLQYRKLL